MDDGGDCHPDAPGPSWHVYNQAGREIDEINNPTAVAQIKTTADDFSVRLPRPLEPWPWEVNEAHLKAVEESDAIIVEPFTE